MFDDGNHTDLQDYIQKVKLIYSENATKFCENFHLTFVVPVKSKVEILQNFVAFSEYMNFYYIILNKRLWRFRQIVETFLEYMNLNVSNYKKIMI